MTSPTDIPKIPARFAPTAYPRAKGDRPGRASDTPAGAVVPGAVVPFPKPHRINPWRGATPADIAEARRRINLLSDCYVSELHAHVDNVLENLSFALNLNGVWAHLADARNELDDALCVAEDRAP